MSATVLCVQEDRALSGEYVLALETRGYEPLPVHDGGQVMEILKHQHADFVLLDVSLPRQDGFEILAQLRSIPAASHLPVLMLCDGDVTADLEERAKLLGAIGVASASMPSDQMLSRVGEFVAPSGMPVALGTTLPESGSLKEIPFPELMHELHQAEFAGVLLVEHGRKRKAIEFRAGWPVCVKSNLVSECLGGYLVKSGRCSEHEVAESIARMKTGEGLQGEILVAMDVLDEEGVVAALEEHALEKLFEIFSWCDGRFVLRAGAELQRGSSIALRGHPSNLIVEGVRRQMPTKWVDRYFEHHADEFVIPAAGAAGNFQAVDLDPKEARWFAGLDGNLRLRELSKAPESLRRLVIGLVSVEILQVAKTAEGAQSADRLKRSREALRRRTARSTEKDETLREVLAQMANRMQGVDHYAVLELGEPTTDVAVEAAFERLSAKANPDLFLDASSSVRQLATQVFDRVAEAYRVLQTAESRAEYETFRYQGERVPAVEQEGRRALRAETEFQKGERLLAEREYESALVHFGRAMENFPAAGEYRSHYGWCLYLCHQDSSVMLHEALEHCREGLKLAKDREKSYLLLGRLYKVMGKTGAAKKMFTRAVQIKPQCVEAMRELRIMDMRREKDKGVLKRLFRR